MSKLDFLLQTASRKTDAATLKGGSATNLDGPGEQGTSTEEKFDFILAAVAEQRPGLGGQSQQNTSVGDYRRFATGRSGVEEQDRRGIADQSSETDRPGRSNLVESSTLRLENVQPPQYNLAVFAQIPLAVSSSQGQEETGASTSKFLDLIRPSDDTDASDLMRTLANGPLPRASVLHQEAHFKPVSNGNFHAELDMQVMPAGGRQSAGDPIYPSIRDGDNATKTLGAGTEEPSGTGRDQAQTVGSNTAAPLDLEHGTLVTQRIANEIVAEASSSRMVPSQEATNTSHGSTSIVIKPSDGVLRVLNIQLHPLELGVVTVKMRLSGEQLEMELHTGSEDTADILRKDTEKLSGLLRASGYRADVLSVHVSPPDSSSQSDSASQRQSSSGQSHSGNFQQNQSSRDEQARHASDSTKSHGFEKQKIRSGDVAANPGGSGVYL